MNKLMILCGMFFPFRALPEMVLWGSRVLPLSYAVDAFRSTLMGYPVGFPELAPIEVEVGRATRAGDRRAGGVLAARAVEGGT